MFFRRSSNRNVNVEFFAASPDSLDQRVFERSLLNLADAPAAMTSSAVNVSSPYLQEPYSSQGPTNGPGGTASGGLIKPDIAAYSNVSTASYGAGAFNGSSSSTPHVAGAAALVKSAALSFTPDQTEGYLQTQAIDMGAPGLDTIFGHGRLYLGNPAVFLSPPTISGLPDQYVEINNSIIQAIDLWAYTSDPFTPIEQLFFSIDNTPNPNAGVSIVANRYLAINPSPGWAGQTQVSVRVTTPYAQFDSDLLVVHVLPPPDISGLPDKALPVNTSLNPAIDLWVYTSDPNNPDDELIFSIDNSPDPNAGVSISKNRYILINPAQNWSGNTQVSVRATSPRGFHDSDLFTVFVLAPPVFSNLPDQYLPINTSLSPAIDLWAYTYDPYIPDNLFAFSIDNSPEISAGVSLSNNRYIQIAPVAGWIGQTQVTVTVTTPFGQSASKLFHVSVGQYKIWNGSVSQDWENPLNWIPEGVPLIDDSVVIPFKINQPQLSNSAAVNNLIIQHGAKLDLVQHVLSVEGMLTNRGAMQQSLEVTAGETTRFLHVTNQASDQEKYFGLDLLPSMEITGTTPLLTVTISGDQHCNGFLNGVRRCYDIQASQPFTTSVTFYFSGMEANGFLPSSLAAFRLAENWLEEIVVYQSGGSGLALYLTAQELTEFGTFALDQSGRGTYTVMVPTIYKNFYSPIEFPFPAQNSSALPDFMAFITDPILEQRE